MKYKCNFIPFWGFSDVHIFYNIGLIIYNSFRHLFWKRSQNRVHRLVALYTLTTVTEERPESRLLIPMFIESHCLYMSCFAIRLCQNELCQNSWVCQEYCLLIPIFIESHCLYISLFAIRLCQSVWQSSSQKLTGSIISSMLRIRSIERSEYLLHLTVYLISSDV